MLRMGLRNVARSGRMKPDRAATLKATNSYFWALPRFLHRHGYPFQSPLAGDITLPYLHLALIDFAIHFMLRRAVRKTFLYHDPPDVIRFVLSTSKRSGFVILFSRLSIISSCVVKRPPSISNRGSASLVVKRILCLIRARAILLKSDLIGHLRLQWSLTYVMWREIIRSNSERVCLPRFHLNLISQPSVAAQSSTSLSTFRPCRRARHQPPPFVPHP